MSAGSNNIFNDFMSYCGTFITLWTLYLLKDSNLIIKLILRIYKTSHCYSHNGKYHYY